MKKIVFGFALVLGFLMAITSCSIMSNIISSKTYEMTVDENTAADQNVTVTFVNDTQNGWFIVKGWNNKDIRKDIYAKKYVSSKDKTILTVPVGSTGFTVDVNFSFSSGKTVTTYPIKDLEFRYELEPGKKYQINGKALSLGRSKGYELSVQIHDVSKGALSKILLDEWKLGET